MSLVMLAFYFERQLACRAYQRRLNLLHDEYWVTERTPDVEIVDPADDVVETVKADVATEPAQAAAPRTSPAFPAAALPKPIGRSAASACRSRCCGGFIPQRQPFDRGTGPPVDGVLGLIAAE